MTAYLDGGGAVRVVVGSDFFVALFPVARSGFTRSTGCALTRLGQDFYIKLGATLGCHFIDEARQCRQMNHCSVFFRSAELAIKIPKISAFRQITAPFALDVFADFVLDGIQKAIGVLAFNMELEIFSHGRWYRA